MKLGIAAALSHNSKLLILDEATSGLDPVVRDEVVELFSDFTRDEGHSILISSHIVSDLEKLCDYIAFLHEGRLMLFEEKDALLAEYCFARGTASELDAIDRSNVIGRRDGRYGSEAIVRRAAAPAGLSLSPVSIEELSYSWSRRAAGNERTDFERPLHYEKILPFGAVDGGDILGRVDIRRFWEPILDIFPRDSRLGHTGDAAVI